MVQIVRMDDATEFYKRVEAFLSAYEAENNLPLGLIPSAQEFADSPYLAYLEDNGDIVAVAVSTPPRGLVLSYMEHHDPAYIEAIAQDVYRQLPALPDVVGQKVAAKAFAECWQGLSGDPFRLDLSMRIYRLDKVNPVIDVSGEARKASEEDRELLRRWLYAFQEEALGDTDTSGLDALVNRWLQSPTRTVLIWYDEDEAVSMAGSTGPTPHGIRIGGVYTPPDHRKRGYASAVVAELSQQMLDAGRQFCFLFTDLSNPTSNHIYQNIGYEAVSDVDKYCLEKA